MIDLLTIILMPFGMLLGWRLGVVTSNGRWHQRWVHDCGFHTEFEFETKPCAKCGKHDSKWRHRIMRARLFGWEKKSKNDNCETIIPRQMSDSKRRYMDAHYPGWDQS